MCWDRELRRGKLRPQTPQVWHDVVSSSLSTFIPSVCCDPSSFSSIAVTFCEALTHENVKLRGKSSDCKVYAIKVAKFLEQAPKSCKMPVSLFILTFRQRRCCSFYRNSWKQKNLKLDHILHVLLNMCIISIKQIMYEHLNVIIQHVSIIVHSKSVIY